MNHREARLLIGGDPGFVPPELGEHLASCPECAQFQREMIVLDANIRRALEHPPAGADRTNEAPTTPAAGGAPVETSDDADIVASVTANAAPIASTIAGPPATVAPVTSRSAQVIPITGARGRQNKRAASWPGWALAASILVGAFATLAIWTLHPTDTLAHDVVAHIQHEPKSWASSQQVTPEALDEILRNAGVTLDANSDKVMYARSCPFRGHKVPHLVVSTSRGPVTVLVLRYESVKARESFHEDGMTGVITPAPRGSIAVLAKGNENIDEVAEQVQKSVRWLPESH
jgi:hypothetical protein